MIPAIGNKPLTGYWKTLSDGEMLWKSRGQPVLISTPKPSTLNPRPSTLNPKPETRNPEPQALNPKPIPQTLNPSPHTLHSEPRTLNPQPASSLTQRRPRTFPRSAATPRRCAGASCTSSGPFRPALLTTAPTLVPPTLWKRVYVLMYLKTCKMFT